MRTKGTLRSGSLGNKRGFMGTTSIMTCLGDTESKQQPAREAMQLINR